MKSSKPQQRGIKFAEAGILFLLILGLTIFVGVRVASEDPVTGDPAEVLASTGTTETPADSVILAIETIVPAHVEVVEAPEAEVVVPEPAAPPRIVTYAEAETAYLTGRYEEAADLFTDYTGDNPGNAWGHYMLGMAMWKAGDPEGAEVGFLAALEINPEHGKSLVNHGRVLLEMDRTQEARSQVEKALEIDARNQDARRVLGRIYHNLGMLEDAETTYLQVLVDDPQDAWALNNLGLILIQQERFAEALPAVARAALLKPDTACMQNNLGTVLERTGYVTAAAEAYGRAVELAEGYAKAEESLERLEGRTEPVYLVPFDLAAAAAAFSAVPDPATDQASEDLAVAAAGPAPTALGKDPEDADDQDR